jgi:hypothetical protein
VSRSVRRFRLASLAAALAAVLPAAMPQPAAAFSGTGNGAYCSPGFAANLHLGQAAVVDSGASVNCPAPGPGPGGTAHSGTQPGRPSAPTFHVHDDCTYTVNYPVDYSETALSGGAPSDFIGPLPTKFFSPPARTLLGTNDLFVPWRISGWYDESGRCVPKNGTVYYTDLCAVPFPSPGVAACVIQVPHPVPGGPAPPGSLGLDPLTLLGDAKNHIQPGTLTSLPTAFGLVGLGTCFFIQNMNTPVSQTLEIPLRGTPDGSGRGVYYIFRIEIDFDGVTWDFGDQSDATDAGLPGQCGGAVASHTYRRYSLGTGDGGHRLFLLGVRGTSWWSLEAGYGRSRRESMRETTVFFAHRDACVARSTGGWRI